MLVFFLAACGGPIPEDSTEIRASPVEVWADPPGMAFEGSAQVVLAASMPGAEIYYTLDGSQPSGEDAIRYTGPLELSDSTFLSFIAKTPKAVWSLPASELYVLSQIKADAQRIIRDLWVDSDTLFFPAEFGSRDLVVRTIQLKATGFQRVTIEHMVLTANPYGVSFWNPNAFSFEILTDQTEFPLYLEPGETLDLVVSYNPTETFSGAAIYIDSDAERDDGQILIELWGRIVGW